MTAIINICNFEADWRDPRETCMLVKALNLSTIAKIWHSSSIISTGNSTTYQVMFIAQMQFLL